VKKRKVDRARRRGGEAMGQKGRTKEANNHEVAMRLSEGFLGNNRHRTQVERKRGTGAQQLRYSEGAFGWG